MANRIKRALVADDDPLVCQIITKLLTKNKIESFVVESGDQALAGLEDNPDFDMAVIDLVLTNGSGWDILDAIKKHANAKNIYTVILTGANISSSEIEKLKKKAQLVIKKQDFTVETFQDVLSGLLNKKK